ncbi:MAG: endonuclease/exonuclease/phosphatase family protein [Candidatus Tectomicrobia bacterium]|uniref:Endonuclease/exonuclease/phosphatase family protein n=1 Tax=Tectimicrobiota bacterium TaxID=2528274 RepID=A0A937W4H8_UNCTE|nr:endonuclease/exonuclease/phosphatase family protein [Candidatus Tectomicrobia bacterium]
MVEIVITLLIVALLAGLVLWAGGGKTLHASHGSGIIEAIPGALEASPPPPDELLVLSYSLGYGLDEAQQTRVRPAAVYDRLDAVIESIAASGAEIALLQEVDFASRRTHAVDQLQYIAAALGWGFVARVITWECRYLPLPFWLPWQHAGRVRAGQGVISRYPLVQNTRQRLSQPAAQPLVAPLFAPYNTVQMVEVQCGSRTARLLNVDLEAHEPATRQRQAQELVAFVRQVATPNCVLMGALHGADQALESLITGLRDRLRRVVETESPSHELLPPVRLQHALVGPGLQTVEVQRLAPEGTSVSGDRPLLVRVRWALPLTSQHRSTNHEHA